MYLFKIRCTGMINKLTTDIVEPLLAVLSASTIRILLDVVQKKRVTIFAVLFQYIGGSLAGYLARQVIEPSTTRLIYVCVITMLSGDLIKYICNPENRKRIFDKLINLFLQ